MKEHRCCMMGEECLGCDNSKLGSLFRGNVPLGCKRQFFLKHLRFALRVSAQSARLANNNLTLFLYGHNPSMKSSPQTCTKSLVPREGA